MEAWDEHDLRGKRGKELLWIYNKKTILLVIQENERQTPGKVTIRNVHERRRCYY